MRLPVGYRLTYYGRQSRLRYSRDFYGLQPWADALRYMYERYIESDQLPTLGPIFDRVV